VRRDCDAKSSTRTLFVPLGIVPVVVVELAKVVLVLVVVVLVAVEMGFVVVVEVGELAGVDVLVEVGELAGVDVGELTAEVTLVVNVVGVAEVAEVAPAHTNCMLLSCQLVVVLEKPSQTMDVIAFKLAPVKDDSGTMTV
jgi:hypothetical protein